MLRNFMLLTLLSLLPASALAECVVLLHGLGRVSNSMSKSNQVIFCFRSSNSDFILTCNGFCYLEYSILF